MLKNCTHVLDHFYRQLRYIKLYHNIIFFYFKILGFCWCCWWQGWNRPTGTSRIPWTTRTHYGHANTWRSRCRSTGCRTCKKVFYKTFPLRSYLSFNHPCYLKSRVPPWAYMTTSHTLLSIFGCCLHVVTSHAGDFRGACVSSLPTNACSTENNIPFPSLANHIVLSKFWKVDLDHRVTR